MDAFGHFQTEYYIDDNGGDSEWIRIDYDFQGRPWKTSYPYPAGAASYTYYNSGGQVIRSVDADGVTELYDYDSAGRREYHAIDMD
ncbi:MAG: hypothetical protein ABII82_09565, partial [Verrucomicrobiota bacterium]